MIHATGLQYFVKNKRILDVPEFEMEAGRFYAVIGPNGSGKTTFFNALNKVLHISSQVYFHGQEIDQIETSWRAKHISVQRQSCEVAFSFTAYEVVSLALIPLSLSKENAHELIIEHMELTDCLQLKNKPFPSLSGGEKQRVNLARVLLQLCQPEKAPLLMLDEPTSAQDLGHQHMILSLLKEFCSEKRFTILAILHDLNNVIQYCDECIVFSGGVIVSRGRPKSVLDQDTVERYWNYSPTIRTLSEDRTIIL